MNPFRYVDQNPCCATGSSHRWKDLYQRNPGYILHSQMYSTTYERSCTVENALLCIFRRSPSSRRSTTTRSCVHCPEVSLNCKGTQSVRYLTEIFDEGWSGMRATNDQLELSERPGGGSNSEKLKNRAGGTVETAGACRDRRDGSWETSESSSLI